MHVDPVVEVGAAAVVLVRLDGVPHLVDIERPGVDTVWIDVICGSQPARSAGRAELNLLKQIEVLGRVGRRGRCLCQGDGAGKAAQQ